MIHFTFSQFVIKAALNEWPMSDGTN